MRRKSIVNNTLVFIRIILIVILLINLSSCKKWDKRVNRLILGQWTSSEREDADCFFIGQAAKLEIVLLFRENGTYDYSKLYHTPIFCTPNGTDTSIFDYEYIVDKGFIYLEHENAKVKILKLTKKEFNYLSTIHMFFEKD